ncbi:tetratricopeptide repeat protein [Hymenobacter busanensis]|uniref:Tetratricopeptide repeat protein n=1 Tax=Hymenobacter busanensis TaxID=2607656 RepID=A0A7L4ZZB4_9BACT|nr:tetratricopeptide repeat protein [Hymenobacter busanensis]KAA9332938.1 tetratricopeptide repeat protein [Hymenobacter busanensis]QHJ08387.1 tetratricopeptide repeat protein [Hymenobacter busanensis]
MSKIPYTGQSPQARQGQVPQQQPNAGQPDLNAPVEHPLLEDPDALAARLGESEEFVRRNKNILFGVLAALVLAIVAGFGYYTWRKSQDEKAQAAMFQAVNYWEADSVKKALKGDGQYDGLETIASEYSGTKAGNLANFYAGAAALKEGQYAQAIDYLEDFSSDDMLIQARAYALIGDANMELKKYKEAADYYQKAADHKANDYFTPGYLMKLATAKEMAKDNAGAVAAYDKIVNDYPTAAEVNDAKIMRARAQAMTGTAAK